MAISSQLKLDADITWVSLIRLGGSEKAEGNLTRLSTRWLIWSGGLAWARSRKKYCTRRSLDGALDSLRKRCSNVILL